MAKRLTKDRNKTTPTQGQREPSSVSLKAIVVVVLTFLGGATLFGAWIAQNRLQARWLEKRLYLERTQLLVQINQNTAEMWQIQLNLESTRQPQNEELLRSAAYNFVKSVTTLLAWEESRVTDGSVAPIVVKDLSHALAKQLLDKRDLGGLLRLVDIAIRTKAQYQAELDQKYFQQMAESKESADIWNGRFHWCYIIGSVLFGVRWFLTAILGWPSALAVTSPTRSQFSV